MTATDELHVAASVSYWLATDQPRPIRPIVRQWRRMVTASSQTRHKVTVAVSVVAILALPPLCFAAWFARQA